MLLEKVGKYFPKDMMEMMERLGKEPEEIRVRAGCPVSLLFGGEEVMLERIAQREEVGEIVSSIAGHSVAAYMDDIRQGFFTAETGVRVGLGGKTVCENGVIRQIRDFTSVNIRMPKELKGICGKLLPYISDEERIYNTLIISAPQNGKTTLLRDMVRAVSSGDGVKPEKCTVVDERSEITGGYAFDMGERCDVLMGCPKRLGISIALRTLSPQVIATDEIGDERELEAISEAVNSGVTVLATAHGDSIGRLKERLFFRRLYESGTIRRTVLLSTTLGRGTLEQVFDEQERRLLNQPVKLEAYERRER